MRRLGRTAHADQSLELVDVDRRHCEPCRVPELVPEREQAICPPAREPEVVVESEPLGLRRSSPSTAHSPSVRSPAWPDRIARAKTVPAAAGSVAPVTSSRTAPRVARILVGLPVRTCTLQPAKWRSSSRNESPCGWLTGFVAMPTRSHSVLCATCAPTQSG